MSLQTAIKNTYAKVTRQATRPVSLNAQDEVRGAALLSYLKKPFTMSEVQIDQHPHSNYWECLTIGKLLAEFGYDVDVIDWDDSTFTPDKKYDLVIDIHSNLDRLLSYLPKHCIKILHITGSYWQFQNQQEKRRTKEIKQKYGVTLKPRRIVPMSDAIKICDFASMIGNSFTRSTFAPFEDKIQLIPLSSNLSFHQPSKVSIESRKNSFLWLGGSGMALKGLDVVLEVFSNRPDLQLTICGPVDHETDFFELFRKELTETSNIHYLGFVNPISVTFRKIASTHEALVYPTASEGQAGSVITAMRAGLIPLVTKQAGVDVDNSGILIETTSITSVSKSIETLIKMSNDELYQLSLNAWKQANEDNSRSAFENAYRNFLQRVRK